MIHARVLLVKLSTVVTALAVLIVLAVASPAAAQVTRGGAGGPSPGVSLRLFGLVSDQQFTAQDTFDASFGSSRGIFWGGGIEAVLPDGIFADLAVSRFKKTGQRAFISGGQVFGLGIPLTATITPIELTGGYRVRLKRVPIVPYVGVGVGSYSYQETSSFSDPSESIDARQFGVLGMVGAEVRVLTSMSASADVQYTRITGILGAGGLSQQANENDLGGLAVRVRIIIGR